MKSLRTLLPYFSNYKLKTALGILFIVLANLFKTYNPVVVRDAINKLVAHLEHPTDATSLTEIVVAFSIVFFVVAILEGIFTFFMRQTIIVVSRFIEKDMKAKLFDHYQYLDQAFFRRNNTGDLMNRVTEDIARVRMFIGPSIMYSLNLLVMFIFCTVNMVRVNWQLALFVLIPMPILSYTIYRLNSSINKTSEELQAKLSDLTTMAQESFSGIRVIQAYVQEKMMARFFEDASEEYKTESLKLARIEAFYFPLIMFLVGFCLLIIILVGGYFNINGKISIGNIAEFMLYLNMLTFPMSALGWAVALTQQAAVSMRRINAFMEEQPSVLNQDAPAFTLNGDIEFRDVTFVYPDSGIKAISHLNLHIKAGQRVAIIGKTGSGKSTIADLCMRMYDVTEGQVLVDGKPIQQVNTASLRQSVGYVPQDVFLFSDTISSNLLFGNNTDNLAPVLAKQVAINEEIEKFPEGYDTMVGERGVMLSGGQKQRISIARALSGNPKMLILDDCLSAVDARTEKIIEHNLLDEMKARTTIVITHRVFSSISFDTIFVLDAGVLIEQGTHAELMQRNGFYSHLYNQQTAE
ncbi:MAG: ABC transporter ATP-binding protein [Chitinophagales bacterium]|nr:ABC transporter ATP-binding protein [Chitinophagales bacterium]